MINDVSHTRCQRMIGPYGNQCPKMANQDIDGELLCPKHVRHAIKASAPTNLTPQNHMQAAWAELTRQRPEQPERPMTQSTQGKVTASYKATPMTSEEERWSRHVETKSALTGERWPGDRAGLGVAEGSGGKKE